MLRVLLPLILLCNTVSGIAQNIAYQNGYWWIRMQFAQVSVYSISGKFSFTRPSRIDSTVDLQGRYCLPPFGDAHTHNLDGLYNLQNVMKDYLNDGVLYVQVTGNYGSGAAQARPVIAKQYSLDVMYANGLLTATYGHGFYPYEPLAMRIYSYVDQQKFADSIKKSRLANDNAYFHIDTEKDLEAKWPIIQSYRPDLIKICVLDAEEYPKKRMAEVPGTYGLSPAMVHATSRKAHASGLRVIAHVETAADARLCAKAGVDGLAHLPGYGWNGEIKNEKKFCITEEDVKLMKESGMYVIPTLNLDYTNEYDSTGKKTEHPDRTAAALQYKRNALKLLIKHKVPLALGSDYFGKTISVELDYIIQHQLIDPKNFLDILCRQTAQNIFPGRKIGIIAEGYEASFLVLSDNPLQNIRTIRSKIVMMVKRGSTVHLMK